MEASDWWNIFRWNLGCMVTSSKTHDLRKVFCTELVAEALYRLGVLSDDCALHDFVPMSVWSLASAAAKMALRSTPRKTIPASQGLMLRLIEV